MQVKFLKVFQPKLDQHKNFLFFNVFHSMLYLFLLLQFPPFFHLMFDPRQPNYGIYSVESIKMGYIGNFRLCYSEDMSQTYCVCNTDMYKGLWFF